MFFAAAAGTIRVIFYARRAGAAAFHLPREFIWAFALYEMQNEGNIMTETGKIREICGSRVTIALDRSAYCFGCINHECKSNGGFISAENPLDLSLETGQTVEVKTPALNIRLLGQAFKALLPPALGFTAGFIIIRLFFPAATEGAAAALGAVFLFVFAFIVYKTSKKPPAGSGFTILRVVE